MRLAFKFVRRAALRGDGREVGEVVAEVDEEGGAMEPLEDDGGMARVCSAVSTDRFGRAAAEAAVWMLLLLSLV